MLARHFAGTEEAAIWNWVYRQPAVDRLNDGGETWQDLLYYSPRPALVKPKRLSFFDPSMGYTYIRSDWDSPDATWIAFWAGPHLDTHEHLDQGAFTIFKRRDLAPKTGHYDDTVFAPHQLSYYTRTVSSNGLLIGDPREVFGGFISGIGCNEKGVGTLIDAPGGQGQVCVPNDGGQRTMAPFGMAAQNPELFRTYRNVFDVARASNFADHGRWVTVSADITNAYNSPRHASPGSQAKVTRVWRRLVYLREADLLVVADVVESTDPAFEKKWLLHALDRLEIAGQAAPVAPGEDLFRGVDQARVVVDDTDPSDAKQTTFDLRGGYAELLLKTVFPVSFRYRRVGGREPAQTPHEKPYARIKDNPRVVRDFSEGTLPNHRSFNWAPANAIETAAAPYAPNYGPGYGRWRLEIEPEKPAKTDFFLNVLKPALDPAAALPPISRVETPDAFGAAIQVGGRTWRVLFAKGALSAPQVTAP
jgi:hypothetical protein